MIDSNRRDNLATVKLYSKSEQPLNGTTSRYKPFVEITDDKGKRIRIGAKFLDKGQRLSKENVATIKRDCFNNRAVKHMNRKKIRILKNR